MDIASRINRAEILREDGYTQSALNELDLAFLTAQELGKYDLAAEALAHRIICHKHFYQNRQHPCYLDDMDRDIEAGLELPISDEQKAVFCLRRGDVHSLRGNNRQALEAYLEAYALVEKGGYVEAEYLGHLGEAYLLNNREEKAVRTIQLACELVGRAENVKALRPFHRAVIISGLKGRLAKAAIHSGQTWLGFCSLVHGYGLAWWLKLYYKKPQRLNQYHQVLLGR